jgi:hypothetical protein
LDPNRPYQTRPESAGGSFPELRTLTSHLRQTANRARRSIKPSRGMGYAARIPHGAQRSLPTVGSNDRCNTLIEGLCWRMGRDCLLNVRFPPKADLQTVRFRAGIQPSQATPPKPPPDARGNALRRSP